MNNLNYGVIGNCRTALSFRRTEISNGSVFPISILLLFLPVCSTGRKEELSDSKFPETIASHKIMSPTPIFFPTQFSSDEGEFVVLDYMPCYRSQDETGLIYLPNYTATYIG